MAWAKANPNKLFWSTAATNGGTHISTQAAFSAAGIQATYVPYKGGAPATMAVLKGEVDLIVNDLSTFKAQIEDGKLRALAVAHTSRLKPLPQVPTFIELGMPEMVSSEARVVRVVFSSEVMVEI